MIDQHGRQACFKRVGALDGVHVASTACGEKPEQRFGFIHANPAAVLVEHREIVLAVDNALFGGLTKPAEGGGVVGGYTFAARVIDAEIMHGPTIASAGGAFSPVACERKIGGDAFAMLIELRELVLRRRIAAFGDRAQLGETRLKVTACEHLK